MLKTLFPLTILIFIVACEPQDPCAVSSPKAQAQTAASSSCTEPRPTPDPDPTPIEDVPNEALMFDAEVGFSGFEREQEEKVYEAIEIIKKVIQTPEFRSRVVNYTYQGKKAFIDNKGLTNAQIYQIILDASENLKPEVDHEMDLELELYTDSTSSTIGYTYPNVLKIWMNTKYFNRYTPLQVAGNVFHEWTHKLGFEHATQYSEARDHSVPYALGYLIEELGKKYQ